MTLLAPLFLLGLLGLTIPWWLHLISTDDPPKQDFGSSMFLEQQQTVSSRQSRLRYLLLLLLRTLAVALIALLFAEPVLEKLQLPGNESSRHIVVVDTSLSQSHVQRWDKTQSLATDIINSIPTDDQVLVVGAGAAMSLDDSNDYSASAALGFLASLSPDAQRLPFSRISSVVNGLVRESPLPVEVHIVSDFQQSAMPDRFSDLAITGIDQLQLYSTATATDSNVSVTAVLSESADGQADLSALVQNHSAQSVTREVIIQSEAGTITIKSIELAADARTLVPFESLDTSNAGGSLTVALSPSDDLIADDTFTIAIPDGKRTDITVISGIRENLATTYVSAAIESDPRYRALVIDGDSVSAAQASAMLIVPDASTLTDRGGSDLQEYLSNGGSVLLFVGSQPHSANIRSLLNISLNTGNNALAYRINTTDASQPVVRGLAGDWRALSLQNLVNISTTASDRIILATADRTPLLIERSVGSGRLLIFASALDPLWNNLALEPLFVPFVIRSLEYLRGESAASRNLSIGDSIALAPGAQLLNSSGESLRELAELTRRGNFTFSDPGVYTVESSSGINYLSVNTDPLESRLDTLEASQFERWQKMGDNESATGVTSIEQESAAANRQSLWYWLLLCLMAVALAESLYSHRHLWVKRGA